MRKDNPTFLHLGLLKLFLEVGESWRLANLDSGLHRMQLVLVDLPFLLTPPTREELAALRDSPVHFISRLNFILAIR